MSRKLAMTCKPVDDILKHYKSCMRQHIRQYDKVRFCLSLTPEQVEILQDTLDKEFPGYVATQKRKYLWVERKPVKKRYDESIYDNSIPDFWYDGYSSEAEFWDCQL